MNSTGYFKLGLFVLIGGGLIAAAAVVLGAGRLLERNVTAETLLDESVDGLEVGAPVKYRGVTIGRVTSIAFAEDKNDVARPEAHRLARYVLVDMALNAKTFKGLTLPQIKARLEQMTESGLRARVSQQGLAGGVYIGLDFVQGNTPPPPQVQVKNTTSLFIPSAPGTMAQVMSAADHLASDLQHANLPQVIQHVDGLITGVSGTVGHVNDLVVGNQDQLKSAVADLPAITGGLKSGVARADQLLRDKRIDQTLGSVANTSATAGQTLNDVRRTSEELRTLITTRQDDIQRIISDLRRTADNLSALSVEARDDPSRLLRGGPPARRQPGE